MEATADASELESRWALAEQRFLEVFFGTDVALRTRQRRSNRRSPLKVSFNIAANIRYDFQRNTLRNRAPGGEAAEHSDSDDEDFATAKSKLSSDRLGRIVRPRTADLSDDLKRRLNEFRELDTIAFIKPSSPIRRSAGSNRMGSASAAGSNQRLSSAKSRNSSARDSQLKLWQTASRPASSTRAASALSFGRSKRPAVELLEGGVAVPRRKRPLARAIRATLLSVLDDALVPALGVPQRLGTFDLYGDKNFPFPTQKSSNGKPAMKPKLLSLRKEHPESGFQYYYNPPHNEPSLSLSLSPKTKLPEIKSELQLRIPHALQSKVKMYHRLLTGHIREGGVEKRHIIIRDIIGMYRMPRPPRVGGRITPAHSKGQLFNEVPVAKSRPNTEETNPPARMDSANIRNVVVHDSIEEAAAAAAENGGIINGMDDDGDDEPLIFDSDDDEAVGKDFDLFADNKLEPMTRINIADKFLRNIGRVFPIDYFMDQTEIEDLAASVRTSGSLRTLGTLPHRTRMNLLSLPPPATASWRSCILTDFDPVRRQFHAVWDSGDVGAPSLLPKRRRPSTSWLTRAEVLVPGERPQMHKLAVMHAMGLRAEFERALAMTECAGILAPFLIPNLAPIGEGVVERMFRDLEEHTMKRVWGKGPVKVEDQSTSRPLTRGGLSSASGSEKTQTVSWDFKSDADAVHSARLLSTQSLPPSAGPSDAKSNDNAIDLTAYLPALLNEIREFYARSQVQAAILTSPALQTLNRPNLVSTTKEYLELPRSSARSTIQGRLRQLRGPSTVAALEMMHEACQTCINAMPPAELIAVLTTRKIPRLNAQQTMQLQPPHRAIPRSRSRDETTTASTTKRRGSLVAGLAAPPRPAPTWVPRVSLPARASTDEQSSRSPFVTFVRERYFTTNEMTTALSLSDFIDASRHLQDSFFHDMVESLPSMLDASVTRGQRGITDEVERSVVAEVVVHHARSRIEGLMIDKFMNLFRLLRDSHVSILIDMRFTPVNRGRASIAEEHVPAMAPAVPATTTESSGEDRPQSSSSKQAVPKSMMLMISTATTNPNQPKVLIGRLNPHVAAAARTVPSASMTPSTCRSRTDSISDIEAIAASSPSITTDTTATTDTMHFCTPQSHLKSEILKTLKTWLTDAPIRLPARNAFTTTRPRNHRMFLHLLAELIDGSIVEAEGLLEDRRGLVMGVVEDVRVAMAEFEAAVVAAHAAVVVVGATEVLRRVVEASRVALGLLEVLVGRLGWHSGIERRGIFVVRASRLQADLRDWAASVEVEVMERLLALALQLAEKTSAIADDDDAAKTPRTSLRELVTFFEERNYFFDDAKATKINSALYGCCQVPHRDAKESIEEESSAE